MSAIEARGLTREFEGTVAVGDLHLRLAEGETLALLGPNGAGKSTTVAMLTTLLRPTAGEAIVAGHDVARAPHEVRARIGVVFQGPSLEAQLTARQNLAFHARLYKLPRHFWQPRAAELLRLVELDGRADEPVHRYSGGMRRRLEVARAVLHQPQVLFLDEPTIGLDPQARLHAWDLLARLQDEEGMAILLTTHHMEEAERLADRVAIMDHGRLLRAGAPDDLKGALGAGEVVRLRCAEPGQRRTLEVALAALGASAGVQELAWRDDRVDLRVASAERALPEIVRAAGAAGALLDGLEVRRPTLEDVFIALTGRALRDAP